MKKRNNLMRYIICFSLMLSLQSAELFAQTAPILNNGKKWRIGYYEGGPFSNYADAMRTLIQGLVSLGWIAEADIPTLSGDIKKPYWDWLTQRRSRFLSFKPEDAFTADWNPSKRADIRKEMTAKLQAKSIDLVIAMGTWAGQDLANDDHAVPVMVMSTSNPVQAGIIPSVDDSGRDHVTARVDPDRYLRQVRMFHRIVGFKKLGLAYENTPDGKIYAALDDVYRAARERNFKVVTCEVTDTTDDLELSRQSCMSCFRELARSADAVYLTSLTCVDAHVSEVADLFNKAKIPTFSIAGSKWVKNGVMLSISKGSGDTGIGLYSATKFAKILNGVKPGDLDQTFEDPLDIAVNMETVRQVGFDMPENILRIANEIYDR